MTRQASLTITFSLLGLFAASILTLSSCCEPGVKDSHPYVIDSAFVDTSGYDADISHVGIGGHADSGYYPIWTFAVMNIGKTDDDFTLRVQLGPSTTFDITRHVPSGAVGYFRTPTPYRDSISEGARYSLQYPNAPINDSLPLMSNVYYGFFRATPDSVKIRALMPTVSIISGAIDNGPEGCNTPAVSSPVDVMALGRH